MAGEAEFGEFETEWMGREDIAAGVEDRDCSGSALEIAGPDFNFSGAVDVLSLLAERVLIDGDDFVVGEDAP